MYLVHLWWNKEIWGTAAFWVSVWTHGSTFFTCFTWGKHRGYYQKNHIVSLMNKPNKAWFIFISRFLTTLGYNPEANNPWRSLWCRILPRMRVQTHQLVQDVNLHRSDLTKLIRCVNKFLWNRTDNQICIYRFIYICHISKYFLNI